MVRRVPFIVDVVWTVLVMVLVLVHGVLVFLDLTVCVIPVVDVPLVVGVVTGLSVVEVVEVVLIVVSGFLSVIAVIFFVVICFVVH